MSSKPQPLYARPAPRICPVCGHASYSAGGIHPQCSVRRADARRLEADKARDADADAGTHRKKAWHRFCPQCHEQVHVRNRECECGYSFDKARARGKES